MFSSKFKKVLALPVVATVFVSAFVFAPNAPSAAPIDRLHLSHDRAVSASSEEHGHRFGRGGERHGGERWGRGGERFGRRGERRGGERFGRHGERRGGERFGRRGFFGWDNMNHANSAAAIAGPQIGQ